MSTKYLGAIEGLVLQGMITDSHIHVGTFLSESHGSCIQLGVGKGCIQLDIQAAKDLQSLLDDAIKSGSPNSPASSSAQVLKELASHYEGHPDRYYQKKTYKLGNESSGVCHSLNSGLTRFTPGHGIGPNAAHQLLAEYLGLPLNYDKVGDALAAWNEGHTVEEAIVALRDAAKLQWATYAS